MNLEQAKALIKNSTGEGVYNIYVPSLKKEVSFKHMTTGQRKTISKVAIEETDGNSLKYQFVKLAIASELCLDSGIDVEKLTDIDFIAVMSGIRKNNIMTPLELTMKCGKCGLKFNFSIDFNKIEENAKKYKCVEETIEKEIDSKLKIKVILSEPTIIMNLSYKRYIEAVSEDQNKTEEDIRNARVMNYPIQFINRAFINGAELDDYPMLDYVDRMTFVDENIPSEMIFNEDDGLLMRCAELFPSKRENSLFYTIECPKCKDVKEDAIAFDSFFII